MNAGTGIEHPGAGLVGSPPSNGLTNVSSSGSKSHGEIGQSKLPSAISMVHAQDEVRICTRIRTHNRCQV
jgi:hypothetical protein